MIDRAGQIWVWHHDAEHFYLFVSTQSSRTGLMHRVIYSKNCKLYTDVSESSLNSYEETPCMVRII